MLPTGILSNMASIVIIGALDTKGTETAFLRHAVEQRGHRALVVDTGVLGTPAFEPAVSRSEVALAGGGTIEALVAQGDRGHAVSVMARGAAVVVARLFADGRLDAVLGVGGGAGTSVGASAMRALPLGVPKLMISTLAGGDVRGFVDISDIIMVPAVVDISGLNRVSREVFARAAAAVCAMADVPRAETADVPLVAASMFGNTTDCVEAARASFERAGYEVLVFHATGTGGRTLEGLVESGYAINDRAFAEAMTSGLLKMMERRPDAPHRSQEVS